MVTIPFGHAVDALCYVLGELKDISATLANLRPQHDLVDKDGNFIKKIEKTAHDYISITALLVNGGGIVDITYAPGISRTNRDFVWEINGTEGTLLLEGGKMGGHVQMYQPTVKLAKNTTGQVIYTQPSGGTSEPQVLDVEKAPDFSYNVGRAWNAWAGTDLDKGASVTTFEDALLRHKMIEAIYRSANHGTRENYL